jgi:para-aminobenzoate synthetase / 4-amino-4-deoxychorismate lyase
MVFQYTGSNMFHSFPLDLLNHVISGEENVVFLDTARPSHGQRYSLLFKNPLRIYRTRTGRHIGEILERISEESGNRWIAGYFSYEAAYWLEDKFRALRPRKPSRIGDLLWFGVFDEPYIFDHAAGTWNRPLKTRRNLCVTSSLPGKNPAPGISGLISRRGYFAALRRIRKLIAAGDVYQVNFTYDVSVSSPLRPWEMYKDLRLKQPVPFGAFIKTRGATVASFSPELFFLRERSLIRVKPMKGTAARGRFSAEDRAKASALAEDPKNRSENIMIVDLLRNDLGRICEPGSVAVRRLFDVERHPTVFQMTSTVKGRLRNGTCFADYIRALFPSGSVTGAPKIRAMEIISELERGPRGVYCGAIGYSSPDGRAVFSVPIRTLQRNAGQKKWRFRVGSGVVWDSSPEEELQECMDKCGFLTSRRPDFRLFESLLFSKGKFVHLQEHGERFFDSAGYFDFAVTKKAWDQTTQGIVKKLGSAGGGPFKVRIFSDSNGKFSWDHEPAGTLHKATVRICGTAVDSDNPFLYHKTTFREWYDKSMNDIRDKKYFDVLHINRRGELTEGARSNVFITISGVLYTPPVRCGLLPGVLRNRLLKAGKCKEKILFPEDLKKAESVFCGNSVRGLVKVVLEDF